MERWLHRERWNDRNIIGIIRGDKEMEETKGIFGMDVQRLFRAFIPGISNLSTICDAIDRESYSSHLSMRQPPRDRFFVHLVLKVV